MYTYYIIRLDFDNGEWGYVTWQGGGQYSLTDDPNSARIFDTHKEASDFYYDYIGGKAEYRGARLKKVFVTTITSQYPL